MPSSKLDSKNQTVLSLKKVIIIDKGGSKSASTTRKKEGLYDDYRSAMLASGLKCAHRMANVLGNVTTLVLTSLNSELLLT